MVEHTVFNRDEEEGMIFLLHRVEMTYAGDKPKEHMFSWIDNGYGGEEIEALGEDKPGFAMAEGGDMVDYDWEMRVVERYGSEVPEYMSVNYALKQMTHIGNSIEDHFTGASVIDVFSKVYCERPELPPEEHMDIVEDPNDELIFQEL